MLFGPSAKDIAREININNVNRDRLKRKTIERSETISYIVKYRFKPKRVYEFSVSQAGKIDGSAPIRNTAYNARVIKEGYPILVKRAYTHHFDNSDGRYLKSFYTESRIVNLRHRKHLKITNDLSAKNQWKYLLDRHSLPVRFVWEGDFEYEARCEWVTNLNDIDVKSTKSVFKM